MSESDRAASIAIMLVVTEDVELYTQGLPKAMAFAPIFQAYLAPDNVFASIIVRNKESQASTAYNQIIFL
ncbi:hypothetical protein V6N11_001167 [Hibiscus sabdariffa]|uniref:Uncharacterized protein n=1 Tax=Hibiscus sabdariffa TaxID=183260 RepID=A0ABR2RZF7_9ROSI